MLLDLTKDTSIESIKLIGNKVLIEPINKESLSEYTTDSGIQIIQSNYRAKRNYILGKIVKLGQYVTVGKHRIPLTEYYSIGDKVLYFESGLTELKIDDKTYVVVRAEDILDCIVE